MRFNKFFEIRNFSFPPSPSPHQPPEHPNGDDIKNHPDDGFDLGALKLSAMSQAPMRATATMMMGTAVPKATRLFWIKVKVMEARAMVIPFKSGAVAMPFFEGTPKPEKGRDNGNADLPGLVIFGAMTQ